jgi:hypothetical protein
VLKGFREWRRRRAIEAHWTATSAKVEAARDERHRRLAGSGSEVGAIESLLFRHDPIGINFGDNQDEYRAEAETIVLRRAEARSVDDVVRIVHEEFVHWFDASIAGPEARYRAIAEDIWATWSNRSAQSGDDERNSTEPPVDE